MASPSPFFISHELDPLTPAFWRSRYCFLLSRGYELPASLAPAADETLPKPMIKLNLVEATRVADGMPVSIRPTTSKAASAHAYAAARARPPWDHLYNHIAPILDTFSCETVDTSCIYVVMPRLLDPMAHVATVADVIEFTQQILEVPYLFPEVICILLSNNTGPCYTTRRFSQHGSWWLLD